MKSFKQLSIFTFLMLVIALTVQGQESGAAAAKENDRTGKDIALFRKIFWDSLPKPVGYINDYENIYTDSEEKKLNSLLADFEESTAIQIALITFDTTMTRKDSLDVLTLRVANTWGIGKKNKNNGVTIGICMGYRKMRIENGYGIVKILTDKETKGIIDTAFIPCFRERQYFEGTLTGLETLIAVLRENIELKKVK